MSDSRCHLKFREFQSFSQYMSSLFAELLGSETITQARSNSDEDVINSSPPTGELIRSQMEAEALHSATAAGNFRWCCRVTQVETDWVTQELLCTPDKVTAVTTGATIHPLYINQLSETHRETNRHTQGHFSIFRHQGDPVVWQDRPSFLVTTRLQH